MRAPRAPAPPPPDLAGAVPRAGLPSVAPLAPGATPAAAARPAEPGFRRRAPEAARDAAGADRVRWIPRQHGAWPMLAVPFLLGVLASAPVPLQGVLAACALTGYLASAAALDWTRAHRAAYLRPAGAFGAVFVGSGAVLLVARPALAPVAALAAAIAAVVLVASAAGHPRSIVASLGQAAQAAALVPATALVAGGADPEAVARATLVAVLYLASSVLVVRSMIREKGNARFLAVSIAYHVAAVPVTALLLPLAYAAIAAGLGLRAALLPALRVRLAASGRRLRPIHLGLVEIAATVAVVGTAVLVRF